MIHRNHLNVPVICYISRYKQARRVTVQDRQVKVKRTTMSVIRQL